MSPVQAQLVVDAVYAVCPSQKCGPGTTDAWSLALSEARVPLEDALRAVSVLAATHQYIAPRDVIQAARRSRTAVIEHAGLREIAPNVDPDRVREWVAEQRAIERAVASGAFDRERYDRGGWTLTGVAPERALGSRQELRPGTLESAAIAALLVAPDDTQGRTVATAAAVLAPEQFQGAGDEEDMEFELILDAEGPWQDESLF